MYGLLGGLRQLFRRPPRSYQPFQIIFILVSNVLPAAVTPTEAESATEGLKSYSLSEGLGTATVTVGGGAMGFLATAREAIEVVMRGGSGRVEAGRGGVEFFEREVVVRVV